MRSERGQAGVEMLIALPVLVLLLLAAAEGAVWVASSVLAGTAADAGARALARGEAAGPAARAELPGPLQPRARISTAAGTVHVVVRVPMLVPGLPSPSVSAESAP